MRAWMVWYYGSMYSSTYYGLCSHLRICYHTPQYTTYALVGALFSVGGSICRGVLTWYE